MAAGGGGPEGEAGVLPPGSETCWQELLLLLWVVGEPPGPGWRAGPGRGVAVLTSMMELEVADLDSRLGGAAGTLSSGMEVEAAELVSGLAQEWLRLLQPQKNVINKL